MRPIALYLTTQPEGTEVKDINKLVAMTTTFDSDT